MTDKANALSKLADKLYYRVENPSAWPEGFDQQGSDLFKEAAQTIRAFATAANPLREVLEKFPRVKVRELEWVIHSIPPMGEWLALSSSGLYCIPVGSGKFPLRFRDKETIGTFDTLEVAKAAAQADYERRILSALESTPAPVSEITEEMVGEMYNAVLRCPHSIDHERVVLKIDHSLPGNALAQLHGRITAAMGGK